MRGTAVLIQGSNMSAVKFIIANTGDWSP